MQMPTFKIIKDAKEVKYYFSHRTFYGAFLERPRHVCYVILHTVMSFKDLSVSQFASRRLQSLPWTVIVALFVLR